jgi:hypothetical protein
MVLLPSLAILREMPLGFLHLSKGRIKHPQPGSIPPRATKNHNSPFIGLFSFGGLLTLT